MRWVVFAILVAAATCAETPGVLSTDPKVEAFFKQAYDLVTNTNDKVHYLVPRMRMKYNQLCLTNPDCDEALLALFDAQYRVVDRALYKLGRLYKFLERLREKRPGTVGRWRRPRNKYALNRRRRPMGDGDSE